MYEDMIHSAIMRRMLARIPADMDKREGSIIWDALSPAALELELAYIRLDEVLGEAFADTASRDFLIRRCVERGISVFAATKAIVRAEFTPATLDLSGKRFNLDSLNYVVTEKISGGVYKLRCESSGTIGNQSFGTLVPIDYIHGLKTAKIVELLIPGENEEDTEALRSRYFLSFGDKAFGGNEKDYLFKANAIEGVGSTKVTRIWNGPGTVKLTILNSAFDKASAELVQTVQNIIDPRRDAKGDGLAPIGHIVTVDTVEELKINISTKIEFQDNATFDGMFAVIKETVSAYLSELKKTWADQSNLIIRTAQIETRLLALDGIVDVGGTKINGVEANLTLGSYLVPVMGVISLGT